jgi:hypothetical protein
MLTPHKDNTLGQSSFEHRTSQQTSLSIVDDDGTKSRVSVRGVFGNKMEVVFPCSNSVNLEQSEQTFFEYFRFAVCVCHNMGSTRNRHIRDKAEQMQNRVTATYKDP